MHYSEHHAYELDQKNAANCHSSSKLHRSSLQHEVKHNKYMETCFLSNSKRAFLSNLTESQSYLTAANVMSCNT